VAEPSTLELCLFGASPSTSNLGVSALFHASLSQLLSRVQEAQITVFDHGRGVRQGQLRTRDQEHSIRLIGAHHSRRLWRGDTLWTMRQAGRVGGLGNRGIRAIRSARAVLDVSGGDSFTDLYGEKRFWGVILPKLITLEQSTPLVLLPQTYGPFRDDRRARLARSVLARCSTAWARDPWSFESLRRVAGDGFDPQRHKQSVDMAFGLERRTPRAPLSSRLEEWLTQRSGPVVGVNVSGLVYLDPGRGRRDYGFRADYRQLVQGLVKGLLEVPDLHLALIPHVLAPPGHYESDYEASLAVRDELPAALAARTVVLRPEYDQCEIKHCISRLDWLCGTRMHATIAALSTGVPVAAVAYSPKFKGIFELCGQALHVADPTELETEDMVAQLLRSFEMREEARQSLTEHLPGVLSSLKAQMDELVTLLRGAPDSRQDTASG